MTANARLRTARFASMVASCAAICAGCSKGAIDVVEVDPVNIGAGLVAHWPFDDGMGNTLSDRSIHKLDGTIVNANWIKGQFGGALRFDGSEVSVPFFPPPVKMGAWTVAGWVRLPQQNFGTDYLTLISTELVFKGGWQMNARQTPATATAPAGPIYYEFAYWLGPTEGSYFTFDCTCVIVDQWVHLAAVVDPAARSLAFYRNGELQGRTLPDAGTALPSINEGSATLYMGRWPPNTGTDGTALDKRPLTGDLDDFVVYSRALAPREIEVLARQGLPNPY